jgi:uncharacterized protein YbjT (DUF2867 family)
MIIVVTGATGNVGRPLVQELVRAGARVRAVTRDPSRAGLPAGVELVESTGAALAGANAVFLNSRALGRELETVAGLARDAGVRKLVALSAINADDVDSRQPSRARGDRNREVEQLAVASGLPWVSLRPTVFASNFAGMWGPQILRGDVVAGPYANASSSPIAEADIAAVAVHALTGEDLDGCRLDLTGPQALTNTELVAILGAALGRPLCYVELAPEAVRERFAAIGFPAPFADAYIEMQATAVGIPAPVTVEVEKVLGRPAQPFADWVREHVGQFTGRGE